MPRARKFGIHDSDNVIMQSSVARACGLSALSAALFSARYFSDNRRGGSSELLLVGRYGPSAPRQSGPGLLVDVPLKYRQYTVQV